MKTPAFIKAKQAFDLTSVAYTERCKLDSKLYAELDQFQQALVLSSPHMAMQLKFILIGYIVEATEHTAALDTKLKAVLDG